MGSVLSEGKTVWRLAHADRVAFLVDGESYYRAVAHALARARHSVFILGWDVHSKIELLRGDEGDDLPRALGPRLAAVLSRNRGLRVYVLDWDYPVFFAQERESRTRLFTRWPVSRRFHIHYDNFHPTGASHHQKVVLVDDSVFLSGGMDIGLGRWDTSEHLARDGRRSDPGFPDYVPAHDVMMMADGQAATAMGELVRERWHRATGERLPAAPRPHDCWPESVDPDVTDVEVGIARTIPAHEDQSGVYEIEALHLAAIGSARRWIFVENQYLTSDVVVGALAARLQEKDGPEIVITLPQNNFGWFEARTIQVMHFRSIQKLRNLDHHQRLRICYPQVPEIGDKQVNLHSKVFVIDDELLHIGSSNMTNRSMRLDTECDLNIEAGGDPRIREAVAGFRNRLLGEHLCMSAEEIAGALAHGGSLCALVDSRMHSTRCLKSVEPDPAQLCIDIGDGTVVDPKGPLTAETVIESFAQPLVRRRARTRLARIAAMLVILAAIAATWRWTPLHPSIDPGALASWGAEVRESALAPLAVLAVYVAASLLVVPVTVLIIATALVFGPWFGIAYSLAGSLTSALFMFGIGRVMGRSGVERLTGRHYRRIAQGMRNRGLLTMVALRLLPIAPFTIVNLVIGVTAIRARDFALGTVIGMAPGTVALSVFQTQLAQAVREPGARSLALLVLVSLAMVAVLAWLRQRLRVQQSPAGGASQSVAVASGRTDSSISATTGR